MLPLWGMLFPSNIVVCEERVFGTDSPNIGHPVQGILIELWCISRCKGPIRQDRIRPEQMRRFKEAWNLLEHCFLQTAHGKEDPDADRDDIFLNKINKKMNKALMERINHQVQKNWNTWKEQWNNSTLWMIQQDSTQVTEGMREG